MSRLGERAAGRHIHMHSCHGRMARAAADSVRSRALGAEAGQHARGQPPRHGRGRCARRHGRGQLLRRAAGAPRPAAAALEGTALHT